MLASTAVPARLAPHARAHGKRVCARACALALAAVAGALPLSAPAEVYRCTDAGGAVTYQQVPCAGGQQGRTVQIDADQGPGRAADPQAAWSAAAAQHRAVRGMPKSWVVKALGTPTEKRPPRQDEVASEVWIFAEPAPPTRVGFVGDAAAWILRDAAPVAAAPAPATPPAMTASRSVESRSRVAAGRACDEVLKDLGPPTRREPAGASQSGATPPVELASMRYVYEPGPGDDGVRLTFTCIQNRVIDVDRALSTLR
jgi:hypothetical protein